MAKYFTPISLHLCHQLAKQWFPGAVLSSMPSFHPKFLCRFPHGHIPMSQFENTINISYKPSVISSKHMKPHSDALVQHETNDNISMYMKTQKTISWIDFCLSWKLCNTFFFEKWSAEENDLQAENCTEVVWCAYLYPFTI